MLQWRRSVCRALQNPQSRLLQPSARRHAHDDHGTSHTDHSTHSVPETETFGRSFYILIFGILPGSVLLYNFSRNPYNPITALLAKYSDYKDTWEQRNTLHTRMVEQAGHDRNLFLNTPDRGYQDLTFPEVFNVGSQIAVPAGHGSANLDKLIAHYKEKAFTEEEEKMQKMKEGKLPGQTSWNGF